MLKTLMAVCIFLNILSAKAQFASEDEVSLITTGGNTSLKTYNITSKNSYSWDLNKIGLNGVYTYGESNDIRSAERWNMELRYDRNISKKIGVFVSELLESNRYAGLRRRYNTDIGGKYTFIETDKNTTSGEAGYRYTIEKSEDESVMDNKDSKARLFGKTQHKINKNMTGSFWLEYLPNFTDSDDYLVNIEPSMSVVLTSTFSLKLAYLWNFDNKPLVNSSKYDYTYTTSLIAKF